MYAVANLLGLNIALDDYQTLGRTIESLQHGFSSGLDINTSLFGGCIRFEVNETTFNHMPKIPLQLVNTGKPIITTGRCVADAAKYLNNNPALLKDFAATTNAFDRALQENNLADIQECIHANHELLTRIQVVPKIIQRFIDELETAGAAAKICGAGASAGESAGVVLAVSATDIAEIAAKYDYKTYKVNGTDHGVRIV